MVAECQLRLWQCATTLVNDVDGIVPSEFCTAVEKLARRVPAKKASRSRPERKKPITFGDPRFELTLRKRKPVEETVAYQDKFILRLPDGMRERIKQAAARNKRSMNTEVVATLEANYPPEPDVFDVLDSVHRAIDQAQNVNALPYREALIRSLDQFSERLASGFEFAQHQQAAPRSTFNVGDILHRKERWERAAGGEGVLQIDLERELKRGLLRTVRGDAARQALEYFAEGKPLLALRIFRLQDVKFAEPEQAYLAMEADLMAFYEENWGDIGDVPPWEREDF
jgi:plasmid stability protein